MKTTPLTRPAVARPGFLGQVQEFAARVATAFESPWVAFGLLFVLQLKVFWGWWAVTDLTAGDTAYYYANAWSWHTHGQGNFVWSPLYTLFYGLFLFVNPDPVWATIAHRIVIVCAVAMLLLAVLRQLLHPAIAWLCAAWCVTNPIIHDALYEAHPFALIPTLTSVLLLATARGPWRRAAGLAVLGITAMLDRSEIIVAVGVLGLGLLILEVRRLRRGDGPNVWRTLLAYTTAIVIAGSVCGIVFLRSSIRGPELSAEMAFKHTLGMRQMYAVGYAQRHPKWGLRPMTQGDGLMQDTFGKRDPTMREMLAANPRAVAEHWWWNLQLLPNGMELLLFNRASGSHHPDFLPPSDPRLNQSWPVFALCGLIALWLAGLVVLCRNWSSEWRHWFAPQAAAWIALLGLACVALPVTLAYRPRPAFMLGFGVSLVALTGMSVWVLSQRFHFTGLVRIAAPIAAIVMLISLPTFAEGKPEQPHLTRDAVSRLLAHQAAINEPGTITVGSSNAISLYVAPGANIRRLLTDPVSDTAPNIVQFRTLELEWPAGEPLHEFLTDIGADYLYVDERMMMFLSRARAADARPFLEAQHAPSWQLIESDDTPRHRWRFYVAENR